MMTISRDPQAGSMIVEAELTLVTLFIFLLRIMEAGRFFQIQEFLTDAAHEGARVGVKSLTGRNYASYADKDTIDRTIKQFLAPGAIDTSNVNVDVDCVNLSNGADISVGTPCSSGCPDIT